MTKTSTIWAANYTKTNGRKIDLIVVHDMEAPERLDTAEAVARYFARPSTRASAHWNFDADSKVRSVRDKDVAWHAPGASHNGLGYEHAGYARQSAAEWRDPYSDAMLRISAEQAAIDCAKYDIPIKYVTIEGLKRGERGITTHNNVSKAFRRSTHWDPGPNFPMGYYLDLIKKEGQVAPPPPDVLLREGSHGPAVAFLQAMLNILWRFRINSKGKAGGGQLAIDPKRPFFGPKTKEAVREFQRFADAMSRMAGGSGVTIDGVVGPQTAAAIAFWVPIAIREK